MLQCQPPRLKIKAALLPLDRLCLVKHNVLLHHWVIFAKRKLCNRVARVLLSGVKEACPRTRQQLDRDALRRAL